MEEVICISSDDEKSPKVHNGSVPLKLPIKREIIISDGGKRKVSSPDPGNSVEKKAKLSSDSEDNCNPLKPKNSEESTAQPKSSTSQDTPLEKIQTPPQVQDVVNSKMEIPVPKPKINEGASTSGFSSNHSLPMSIQKPKLVVRKKVPLVNVNQPANLDLFNEFLRTCAITNESKDMEKILSKLKKRHARLNKSYRESESFGALLKKKMLLIADNPKRCFVHMVEVNDEMKARQVPRLNGEASVEQSEHSGTQEPSMAEEASVQGATEGCSDENPKISRRERKKLKELEVTMRRCEKRIKKLEEAEVDFDDENDSQYIMLEKYKSRMVDLYNKYCEMTGEKSDAGRVYLRPKHLTSTPFPALDHAISSFVNAKIGSRSRNSTRKRKMIMDPVFFPDYQDILSCVESCTKENNLGLDKRNLEKIAQDAFVELGENLQRARKRDYWDTFSLYLEEEDADPASEDTDLAEKLKDNKEKGDERLSKVLEDFVKKEEEAAAEKQAANAARSEEATEDDDTDKEDSEETDEDSDRESEVMREDEPIDESESKIINDVPLVEEEQPMTDETNKEETECQTENINGAPTTTNVITDDSVPVEAEVTPVESDKMEVKSPSSPVTGNTEVVLSEEELKIDPATPGCVTPDPEPHDPETTIIVEEEEKPILRVRSFAKPPGFWKDSQETPEDKPSETSLPVVVIASPKSMVIRHVPVPTNVQKPAKDLSPKKDPVGKISLAPVSLKSNLTPVSSLKNNLTPASTKTTSAPINYRIPASLARNVINVKTVTNNYTVTLNNQDVPEHSPVQRKTISPRNIVKVMNKQGGSAKGDTRRTVSVQYGNLGNDKTIIAIPSLSGKETKLSNLPASPGKTSKGTVLLTRHGSGPSQVRSGTPSLSPRRYVAANSVQGLQRSNVTVNRDPKVVNAMTSLPGRSNVRVIQRGFVQAVDRKNVPGASRSVGNEVSGVQRKVSTVKRPENSPVRKEFRTKRFVKISVSPGSCNKATDEVIELT